MIDLVGKQFGSLTVLKFIGKFKRTNGNSNTYRWLCRCICGNEKEYCVTDLKKGSTTSCGCKKKELMSKAKSLPDGEAALNNIYAQYLKNCVEYRGYIFELTKNEFINLVQQNCYYCGIEPFQIKKSKNSFIKYNGIDRVDNELGYLKNNVVPCCGPCNSKKSGVTKNIIFKVYDFLKKRESK